MALVRVFLGNEDLTEGKGVVVETEKIPEIISQGFRVLFVKKEI